MRRMGFAVASASQWTDLTCAFENGPDLSGDLEQVIDVGLLGCALAPLVHMPAGGGVGRSQHGDPINCAHSRWLVVQPGALVRPNRNCPRPDITPDRIQARPWPRRKPQRSYADRQTSRRIEQ